MNNIETVQAIYRAFGRGDVSAILERIDPDVEWEHDAVDHGIPWLVPRRGREAVAGYFQSLSALEIRRFEPTHFLANDTQVFASLRVEATVRATGREFKDFEGHLFSFDARGRVVRFRHFVDTWQHLTASRV